MATLTPRQEKLYNHTVDLYRPTTPIVAGKPGPTTYALAEAGVRCRINIRNSPSGAMPIGRVEQDVIFAIDTIAFPEDQVIDDGWWIVSTTLRPDGTESSIFGRLWAVRGEPQRFIDSERRRGGRKVVMASQESRGPVGVPV